jgi:cell division septum initiation protein DivIVA
MRGYDREAVDRYVSRVNRVLAELQITAAPESAIRHALAQVTDETQGLLERAHETAEEITRRSRSQADDRIQGATREAQQLRDASEQEARQLRDDAANEAREVREAAAREAREVREAAQREAREIRETAEVRVRELEADARAIIEERARMVGELRELVRRLGEFADGAAGRYPVRRRRRPRRIYQAETRAAGSVTAFRRRRWSCAMTRGRRSSDCSSKTSSESRAASESLWQDTSPPAANPELPPTVDPPTWAYRRVGQGEPMPDRGPPGRLANPTSLGPCRSRRVDSFSMLKLKRWLIKVMPFLARWGSNTTPNP